MIDRNYMITAVCGFVGLGHSGEERAMSPAHFRSNLMVQ
jgi:hypothetical protein